MLKTLLLILPMMVQPSIANAVTSNEGTNQDEEEKTALEIAESLVKIASEEFEYKDIGTTKGLPNGDLVVENLVSSSSSTPDSNTSVSITSPTDEAIEDRIETLSDETSSLESEVAQLEREIEQTNREIRALKNELNNVRREIRNL